jgi:hypothetical protein
MSFLKYFIFGIIVSVLTLLGSQQYFKQQSLTFEDCVINNIKTIDNTSVISEIKSMCKKKFNIKDEVLNNEDVKKKMNELFDLFEDMKKRMDIKLIFYKVAPPKRANIPNIVSIESSIATADRIIPISDNVLFSSLPLPMIPQIRPAVPKSRPKKKIPIAPKTTDNIPRTFDLFDLFVFFLITPN